MSKNPNVLTIEQLLEQKAKLKSRTAKTKRLHVESLEAEIVIKEPQRAIALEGLEMVQDGSRSDLADLHMVYHAVVEPNLKDPRLQEAFECKEPTDIVEMLFKPGEISMIAGFALELAGYAKGVRPVVEDEVKN